MVSLRGLKMKMKMRLLIAEVKRLFQKKSSHHSNSPNRIIKPVKRMRKKRYNLSKLMQSKN